MLIHLRRRLGWKLFASYLLVTLVGVIVLATAVEFAIPNAFERHMASMGPAMNEGEMMGGGPGMMGDTGNALFTSFRNAVNEALLLAVISAALAAGIASVFIARRVVAPVQALTQASQRIAAGNYEERVPTQITPGREDELDHLALSFNQMAAQLARTEAMRRQLLGDVAHELRTPLTTIKGSMEGLMDGVLPADETTFQQVYQEAARLQRLVNDLQELSRVEARAYELHPRPVEAKSLIEGVVARLTRQFQEKDVSLFVDLPPGLPRILADEDRFAQILTNLLGNALQYTPPEGQVSIQCTTSSGQELKARFPNETGWQLNMGNWLLVTIRDTGIGLSPEHLPHVFDRFYRVDKSRSRAGGGSGIGLTITKHLVEAHGGRIWVESEGDGKGSAFTIVLPVA